MNRRKFRRLQGYLLNTVLFIRSPNLRDKRTDILYFLYFYIEFWQNKNIKLYYLPFSLSSKKTGLRNCTLWGKGSQQDKRVGQEHLEVTKKRRWEKNLLRMLRGREPCGCDLGTMKPGVVLCHISSGILRDLILFQVQIHHRAWCTSALWETKAGKLQVRAQLRDLGDLIRPCL